MSDHHIGALKQGPQILDVRWIYHSGYYDGPLSGMVRLPDGREAWAEMVEECGCYDKTTDRAGCSENFYRRYQLWTLTPKAAAVQREVHRDFCKYVGHHTDHGSSDRLVHPQEGWHRFYDKWGGREVNLLEGATPAGWFEL